MRGKAGAGHGAGGGRRGVRVAVLDLFARAFVRARGAAAAGERSDLVRWNFLISKGPEKKSNAATGAVASERANQVVARGAVKVRIAGESAAADSSIGRFTFAGMRETAGAPVN